jgi:hypothetical protein
VALADLETPDDDFDVIWLQPTRLSHLDDLLVGGGVKPEACVLLWRDVDRAGTNVSAQLGAVHRLAEGAATCVLVGSDDEGALGALVQGAGLRPSFVGSLCDRGSDMSRRVAVAVVDSFNPATFPPPPPDFSVTAIMMAFNEEDIIADTVGHLVDEGARVHLIDNWSTDRTVDRLGPLLPGGMVSVERFPLSGPADTFDLVELLHRMEEVAAASGSDWVIHNDADEIRRSPWPGVSLRHAFHRIGRAGFNAVDHTVLEFWPVDDAPIRHLEEDRRYFHFGLRSGHFVQIKAWTPAAGRAVLAQSGGHQASFQGRRVFPYKFLTKHYPIRSQTQGERKVLRERHGRWNPEEKARGWHVQYDRFEPGSSFLRDRTELEWYDEEDFNHRYLIERLTGLNLPPQA